MGALLQKHENYLTTFIERFNQRCGPSQPTSGSVWQAGGIAEIAALQKQFNLFRPGRPFVESAALLGLSGLLNSPARDRWVQYLEKLPGMRSDDPNQNGDERIVNALARNLESDEPLPCHLSLYDGRTREPGLVLVEEGHTVFYLESVRFLTIKFPVRPID